jgi:hypothetical protein
LLVGFAGALRCAELAAIRFERPEKHREENNRASRPLPHSKRTTLRDRTLPSGDTELCLSRRGGMATGPGLAEEPVSRRIWLPPRRSGATRRPPPLPWSAPRRSGLAVVPIFPGARPSPAPSGGASSAAATPSARGTLTIDIERHV